jgi:hypothetical protein
VRHDHVSPRLIALFAISLGCGARTSDNDVAGVAAPAICSTARVLGPRACIGRVGDAPAYDANLSLDAIVIERATASTPTCFTSTQSDIPSARYEVQTSSGAPYVLEFEGPAEMLPVLAPKERIRIEFVRRALTFTRSPEHLSVTDAGGLRTLFAAAGGLAELPAVSGVAMLTGPLSCTAENTCSRTRRFGLKLTHDGASADIAPNEIRDVGDLRVFHTGLDEVNATGACADCCSGHVALALVRR